MDQPNPTYDTIFFDETALGSAKAARVVLAKLRILRAFSSVVDVGCGIGAWLKVARALGAERVIGIDGDYVPEDRRAIAAGEFLARDLEQPLEIPGRFDLLLCLELAEHVSPPRGPSLVAELVAASDFIAFSAAIPYQGGDRHVNEMWPAYWARLFAEHGYRPWDGLRKQIWNDVEVPWWYRQNLILFVSDATWPELLGDAAPTAIEDLNVIHPECYLWAARRAPADFKTAYDADVSVYRQAEPGGTLPPGYGPEFAAPLLYGRKQR